MSQTDYTKLENIFKTRRSYLPEDDSLVDNKTIQFITEYDYPAVAPAAPAASNRPILEGDTYYEKYVDKMLHIHAVLDNENISPKVKPDISNKFVTNYYIKRSSEIYSNLSAGDKQRATDPTNIDLPGNAVNEKFEEEINGLDEPTRVYPLTEI